VIDLAAVWDAHPKESYRRDISHWRGHGRWTDSEWRAIGTRTIAALREAGVTLLDGDRHTFLEWGPGGGANAVALMPWAKRYIGVDISHRNLAEALRQAGGVFHPVLIGSAPRVHDVAPKADVFLSTAVFQHFPSDAYAELVLREIHRLTMPGARGVIQVRLHDDTGRFGRMALDGADYYRDHICAWATTEGSFRRMCLDTGFIVRAVFDRDPAVSYATFGILRP
jgi:hypothetical protein